MLTVSICSLSLFTVFVPLSLPHTQSLLTHLSLFIICSFFLLLSGFMIVFMHMVCLCFLFQPHYIHSALPALVSLAFCVCRLLQLPRENAQVILLILQTWEQKKGGYIKAGGPNGFFLLNFYTLTTFFFLFGEKFSSKAPGSFSQVEKLLV